MGQGARYFSSTEEAFKKDDDFMTENNKPTAPIPQIDYYFTTMYDRCP